MSRKPVDPSQTSKELTPEWAEYETAWSIDVFDFPTPVEAAQFLLRRKELFIAAQAAGIPKELLTGFDPSKPGFVTRAREAMTALNRKMGWAAE